MEHDNDSASYIIALTMECNLRCIYCFEEGKYTSEKLDDKTLELIYQYIR